MREGFFLNYSQNLISDYGDGFGRTGYFGDGRDKRRSNALTLLFFPVVLLWLELNLRLSCGEGFEPVSLGFTALLTLPIACVLTIICTFGGERLNRVLCNIFLFALTLWFGTQIIYKNVFGTFLVVSSIGGAGQAANSYDMIFDALRSRWFFILMDVLPLIFSLIAGRFLFRFGRLRIPAKLMLLGVAAAFQLLSLGLVSLSKNSSSNTSPYQIYYGELQQNNLQETFGLLTMQRLDIQKLIFGTESTVRLPAQTKPTEEKSAEPEKKSEPQITVKKLKKSKDKDIQTINEYVSSNTPSYTNDYTGMFEGYNVIFLSAESFSHYCIDKDITPNLYKMYNEGFRFTNYYVPGWGVSTTDGEYANLTGLIPKAGVWSFSKSAEQKNLYPFSLAAQAKKAGFKKILAYHNHTYTYYDRDKYLTNLGYKYKGIGNGLKLKSSVWPNSDLEMIEATVDEYVNSESFSVYYMTVSGHGGWSDWNMIALRHKDEIEKSRFKNYSTDCKVYLAANIELDEAIGKLMSSLKKAGKLDNTLICLTADHYPYALDDVNGLDELAGHKVERTFERYRNAWLLWSGSMKKSVTVDRQCSSLDILPTLNNLLGYKYDSRMLMGTDVFSDAEPLVVFLDRSFITRNGKYDAGKNRYTRFKGKDKDALDALEAIVGNKFTVSRLMLEKNYFSTISS